jgi:Zn-dependent M16 (insulinase) family peptidase
VTLSFDTKNVPKHLHSYLLLFLDLILESPVKRDDVLIPYEEVVSALEEEMLSCETSLGIRSDSRFGCGPFSNTATLKMQIEVKKFTTAVTWMTSLIFDSVFTAERVYIVGSKLLRDVATAKRNGYELAKEISKAIYYKKDTNVQHSLVMRQHEFLTNVLEKLMTSDGQALVIKNLNLLRDILIPTISLYVAANIRKVTDLITPLTPLVQKVQISPEIQQLPITLDSSLINPSGNLDPKYTGIIVGIGSIESSFMFHTSPGINNFMDPDLPAIRLYLQYLTQQEGPMYKKIRKSAYNYSLFQLPIEGLTYLTLYRATNIYEAYKDTMAIIDDLNKENSEFDQILIESAKSSLIFDIINFEKSIGDLAQQAMFNSFKGISKDFSKFLVDQVAAVMDEDLRRVGIKHFKSMFDSKSSKIVIVCHPDKVDGIKKQFEEVGHNLKKCGSLDESIFGI